MRKFVMKGAARLMCTGLRAGCGVAGSWRAAMALAVLLGLALPAGLLQAAVAFSSVSPGQRHACGIDTSIPGVAYCWGANEHGQLGIGSTENRVDAVKVAGLSNVSAVSTGATHSCAVAAAGAVWCWGDNSSGQLGDGTTASSTVPVQVVGLPPTQMVAAGRDHGCALTDTGQVYCWGGNAHGQLGTGNLAPSPTPQLVPGLSVAGSITVGDDFTCAFTNSGELWCWGSNEFSILADPFAPDSPVPVEILVSGGGTLTGVTAGRRHVCVVSSDYVVSCWGDNREGQAGQVGPDLVATPTPVTSLTPTYGIDTIAAGACHTCGRNGSAVWCWGANEVGQLGDGSTTASAGPRPVTVSGTLDLGLAAGGDTTCVRLDTGVMHCTGWFWNLYGSGDDFDWMPVKPHGQVSNQVTAAAGSEHTCVASAQGTAQCWGRNDYGQLGDGTRINRSTAALVDLAAFPTGTKVLQVATGAQHSCALLDTDQVVCWGRNQFGQLGIPMTFTEALKPTVPAGVTETGVVNVVASRWRTCVRYVSGDSDCWGGDPMDDGVGGIYYNAVPDASEAFAGGTTEYLAAGGDQACKWDPGAGGGHGPSCLGAVYLDQGSGAAWLFHLAGQDFGFMGAMVSLAVGGNHGCALADTGAIQCWGRNHRGQLGDGGTIDRPAVDPALPVQGLSGVVVDSVAAGGDHSCALASTGEVWCWGDNERAELGRLAPAMSSTAVRVQGLDGVMGVAAGEHHNCAVVDVLPVTGMFPPGEGSLCWGDNRAAQLGNRPYVIAMEPLAFRVGAQVVLADPPASAAPGSTFQLETTVEPTSATGQVTFLAAVGTSPGTPLVCSVPGEDIVTGGVARCTTSIADPETYNLTASYPGDAEVAPAQSQPKQIVIAVAEPTFAVFSPAPQTPMRVNEERQLVVLVTANAGTPTGVVDFSELDGRPEAEFNCGGAWGSTQATVIAGQATCWFRSAVVGTYAVVGHFSSPDFGPSDTAPAVINVIRWPSKVSFATLPTGKRVGEDVVLQVQVSAAGNTLPPGNPDPTGTVQFTDGAGSPLACKENGGTPSNTVNVGAGGIATCTVVFMMPADVDVALNAHYSGDGLFDAVDSTGSNLVRIDKWATTTDLQPLAVSVAVNVAFDLTATINPDSASAGLGLPVPSGSVSFTGLQGTGCIDHGGVTTVPITGAVVSCRAQFTSAGTRLVTASYSGDGYFRASTPSPAAEVTVTALPRLQTTTVLDAPTSPQSAGTPVTWTATVTPAGATGTVRFTGVPAGAGCNGTGSAIVTLSGNTATCVTSYPTAGTYSTVARYSGDAAYEPSDSTSQSVVITGGAATTSVTLSASPTTVGVGGQVTLQALVSPSAATGSVRFLGTLDCNGTGSNLVALASGSATCVTRFNQVGSYEVQAEYGGSATFLPATSASVTITVGNVGPQARVSLEACRLGNLGYLLNVRNAENAGMASVAGISATAGVLARYGAGSCTVGGDGTTTCSVPPAAPEPEIACSPADGCSIAPLAPGAQVRLFWKIATTGSGVARVAPDVAAPLGHSITVPDAAIGACPN